MKYLPHVIALALVFVAPAWDYFETKRLKASADPRRRVRWYAKIIVFSWIFALGTCAAFGWKSVFRIAASASWLPEGHIVRVLVAGALIGGMAAQVVMLLAIHASEKTRAKIAEALRPMYFILPVTREERRWWIAVSLTAGVCEEIVYRGFLIPYFMVHANLPVTLAIIASSLVFGMAHIYQGLRGAIGAALLGMVFAVLFVMTGNLWVPITLHALIDARLLLMISEGQNLEPVAQAG
jgi:uncharacterized protein